MQRSLLNDIRSPGPLVQIEPNALHDAPISLADGYM